MLNVFNFPVQIPDDLLVWADLFEEGGFLPQAAALRLLHRKNRWPGLVKRTLPHCRWFVFVRGPYWDPARPLHTRAHLTHEDYGFDPGTRQYPNFTLAFLDLINHLTATDKLKDFTDE